MTNYPNYGRWLALLDQRNTGVLFVVAVAACAMLILIEFRWLFPRFYPAARNLSAAAYLGLLILSLIGAMR